MISFERLEDDFQVGKIRSVSVDHQRRCITLVSDEESEGEAEMKTISTGQTFVSERNGEST